MTTTKSKIDDHYYKIVQKIHPEGNKNKFNKKRRRIITEMEEHYGITFFTQPENYNAYVYHSLAINTEAEFIVGDPHGLGDCMIREHYSDFDSNNYCECEDKLKNSFHHFLSDHWPELVPGADKPLKPKYTGVNYHDKLLEAIGRIESIYDIKFTVKYPYSHIRNAPKIPMYTYQMAGYSKELGIIYFKQELDPALPYCSTFSECHGMDMWAEIEKLELIFYETLKEYGSSLLRIKELKEINLMFD